MPKQLTILTFNPINMSDFNFDANLDPDFGLLDDETQNNQLTPQVMQDLKATSGWLRYIGVLGSVGSVLIIIVLAYSVFSVMGTRGISHRLPASYFWGIFFMVGFFAFSLYMCILIFQYGAHLKDYLSHRKVYDLEEAFAKQKRYWILAGVTMSIIAGLYLLLFIFSFFET